MSEQHETEPGTEGVESQEEAVLADGSADAQSAEGDASAASPEASSDDAGNGSVGAATSESSVDDDEEEELSWEDRLEQLKESAERADGDEAVQLTIQALTLLDRKDPAEFEFSEIWGDALDRNPGAAKVFWDALNRRVSSDQDMWTQISMSHQMSVDDDETGAVKEVWGWIQLLRSGEVGGGKENLQPYAEADPNSFSAQMLAAMEVAEAGNWRKVEQEVSGQLEAVGVTGDAAEVEVAHRLADLALGLGSQDRAVELLRRAQRSHSEDDSLRTRLMVMYRDVGKWNAYVDLLKDSVDRTDDVQEKVDTYLELVRVYSDEMNLDAMVAKQYEALLEIQPGNQDAIEALSEAYESSRRWPDLVSLLQTQAEAAPTKKGRVRLNLQIANVYLEKLSRQVDAIKYFEKVLEGAPTHQEAISNLKELYSRRREWEKLIEIHKREISQLEDADERAARLKEVADIATSKLRKPAAATEIWKDVLAQRPADEDALDALENLYEREKDWENLAEILSQKAELTDDPDEQIKLWQKLGSLYGDRTDNSAGAIRAWRKVLELDAEHHKALDSLRKLLIEAKAWDELEAFYMERDAANDLVRVFETLANTSKDSGDIIELLFRAATVWEDTLETPERAVRALEKIFETDPQNARAAARLAPFYMEYGDAAKLVSMLEIQLGSEEDESRQVELALQLATLNEEELEEEAAAYGWYKLAVETRPSERRAYDGLERVSSELGQEAEVASLYRNALEALESDEDRLEVRLRLGRIMAESLDQVDEALAMFEGVLEKEPDNLRALGALEGILERTGRFDELIKINQRRLELATAPEERAEILLSSARINENQRDDKERAIQSYEQARELAPDDPRPLVELHRLYKEQGNFEALAKILRERVRLVIANAPLGPVPTEEVKVHEDVQMDEDGHPIIPEGAELTETEDGSVVLVRVEERVVGEAEPQIDPEVAIPLWFELGTVAQYELQEYDEAVAAYGRIVALDPDQDATREALEALLEQGIERGRVSRILEPMYEFLGDYEELVSVLRVQLDTASETEEQVVLLERIGRLLREELGEQEEAFSVLSRALGLDPGNDPILNQLTRIAETLDEWPRLVETLEEIAGTVDDNVLKTTYHLFLADLYENKLGDPDKAREYGRDALSEGGDDPEVLEALEALYTRTEAWKDLLAVLQKKAETAEDPEEKLGLKLRVASVMEEHLEMQDEAIEVYLGVLEVSEDNPVALDSLDRLYAELGRWEDAAANLERRLELLEDEEDKDVVRCVLARVLHEHLDASDRAIDIYRDVLDRQPGYEMAVGDLESMLETVEPVPAITISEILLPMYDEADNWQKRAWVDEQLLRVVEEPERKVELLHEIAKLNEEKGQDYEAAFKAYTRAFAVDPADEFSLEQLLRYADALGAWSDLVTAMEQAASGIADAQLAKTTQMRVAEIYREKLGDLEGATQALERASDFDPEDDSILDHLESIYREKQAWEPLTGVFAKKAVRAEELDDKKEYLFQAAIICEEMLEEIERATDMYREVLSLDPDDQTAIDSLERLYLSTERWDELMGIYSIKVSQAEGAEEQKELYYVMGALQERELDDLHGAIETYRKVLDIDPDDVHALESLDRLYLGTDDWTNLLEILEREEAAVADPDDKLNLRYRQGQVWHRHLDELPRAIDVYQSVLDVDAAHEPTLEALEELVGGVEYAVDAARVLEPVYKSLREWEKLVNVYEVMIAHSEDVPRKIELLSTIGTIQEDMLGHGDAAFGVWLRAVKLDPQRSESWEILQRIAGTYEKWEALVVRGREMLADLDDTMDLVAVASRLAQAYEEQLESYESAIEMWKQVLDYEPTDESAIKALDRLYERQQMFPELAEILKREVEFAADEQEILQLRYRLALIYENFLEDIPEAVAGYNEILMIQPGNSDAIEALERMFDAGQGQLDIGAILEPYYRETENWERLVNLSLALLENYESPDDRYQKLLDVADIFTGPLENPANALFVFGRALVERPGDELAMARLNELSEETGAWEEAVDFYDAALEATDEPPVQKEMLWRMATALDEKIGDVERAERAYLQMLEIDPDAIEALQALDRIYMSQGRWEELAEIIKREIMHAPGDHERVELHLRLGEVLYEMLGEPEQAIEAYREVTAIDPAERRALNALERVYLNMERWGDLYEVFGQQATVAADEDERADIWAKMANLAAEVLERPEEAVELWYQVLDVRSDDMGALQALEGLFQRADRWADMSDVIERQVPLVEDDADRLELYKKLGLIWRGPLENDERALQYWRKAMEVEPEDLETLRAIKEIDEIIGDYEDLVDIIRRIVALGVLEHDEQLAHYVQLGEILSQVLIRPDEAIETWIQVLQLDPAHLQALVALEQLYVDQERWEEAVTILDQKAEVVESSDDALGIRMQIAEIWETRVGNEELAAGAYERVLEMDPSNDEAFYRLESLYNGMESHQDLLGLYITRAEVAEEPDYKVEILVRGAGVAEEKLQQPDTAFVVLQTALAVDWRNEAIAHEFERLAEVTGNWQDLVSLYEGIIEDVEDPKEALELHNNVARWYFHKLNNYEQSWHHFQFVLGLDPNNMNALGSLSEIYTRLGNWQDFVNVQVHRAELSEEIEEKVDLYTQVASTWEEQLENQEEAISAYRKVLELDDGNMNALHELERIFHASQRWQELVEVLEMQSQLLYEPEEVVKLRYRIGELWETALEDDEASIDAYRQVLAVEETHAPTLEALERLYTRLERWQDLIGVYELQLSAAETAQDQITLYTKMATVYEEEFQDVDNAIACMQHITMVDPTNLMAVRTLERLYRDNQRWPDLVDALNTHIGVIDDQSEKLSLYEQLGEVYREHLEDYYRAIEAYRNILEIDAQNRGALEALADLYFQSADWMTCIETLNRLVGVVDDPNDGVAIQHRIGTIYEEQLSEYDLAEERYQIALDLDPSYMPSIDALQQIYERREDWSGVIRILKQKVEYTRDLDEKAELLCLIGQIYDQRLGDSINAIDYYEQTLHLAPSNVYAARPLAEKYIREQKWARAETLLEMLVQQLGYSRDVDDLYLLHYWLGLSCQELGQDAKALQSYREAYELNQAHLPTLLGMGHQLYKAADYERAYKMFQTILVQYPDQLDGEQLTQLYYDSARIKLALNDHVQGQHLLEKVLELDPTHEEALHQMIDLQEEQDDWAQVVHYKQHLMNVAEDTSDRFTELSEIAEIYKDRLGDLENAIRCYREALELEPDSKFVLLKLLDIYTNDKQWDQALEILERLCSIETSGERLAKFNYTMAVISRDELGDDNQAVDYFNRALDSNVNELRAFEAIDRILTAMKNWRELERNYRKMIKRVYDQDEGQFGDTKFLLWYGLAEIYRTRLNDWESAISAFQQAAGLRPGDEKMHRILADLYVRVGDQDDNAINEFKTLINMPLDPTDPYQRDINDRNAEFYHSLFKLYLKTKNYDAAWCTANVMDYLRVATDEETQFNERYLGPSLVQAQGRLQPDVWKLVYHEDENLRIGNIFNILQAYCRDLFAFDLKKTWSLKRKDELDQNADFLFCKMYRYLAQAIGVVPAPKLYLKRDQALGMINGNVDPPGFIVGADMMQGRSQRELAFIIARQLTLALPIHYLGSLRLPTENLKFLMMGAIQAANPNPSKAMDPNLEAVVKAINKMPPPVKIDLGKIMKPILDGRVEVNISAWLKAIDHTANRIGLLLCGDVEIAMTAIKNDPAVISKLTVPEKERELLKYAISDEFFEVRRRLGLSIT